VSQDFKAEIMFILTQLSSEEAQEIFHIRSSVRQDQQAAQFTGTVAQDFKTETMFNLTQMSSEESQEIFHIWFRDWQAAHCQFTGIVSQDFKTEIMFILTQMRSEGPRKYFTSGPGIGRLLSLQGQCYKILNHFKV
jgi:hypothetical protein